MKLVSACISDDIKKENPLIKKSILAGNGIFEEHKSWLGTSIKKVNDYELGKEYPFLEESLEIAEGKTFTKIPKEAIEAVIKWYAYITEKNGEEAQVVFYKKTKDRNSVVLEDGTEVTLTDIPGVKIWNEEIFSYTPIQNNSGSLTSVSKNDKYYDILNMKFGLYVETHSHNSMGAFRSATDEKYSYNDGIQLVFGKLNTENPEMYSWICVRELQRAGLSAEELEKFVEFPEYEYQDSSQKMEFKKENLEATPEEMELFKEWDEQIEIKVYTPTYTSKISSGKYSKNKDTEYYQYDFWNSKYGGNYTGSYSYSSSYMSHSDKLEEASDIAIKNLLDMYDLNEKEIALAEALTAAFIEGLSVVSYTSKTSEEIAENIITLVESYFVIED